jgi:hypothetical protein
VPRFTAGRWELIDPHPKYSGPGTRYSVAGPVGTDGGWVQVADVCGVDFEGESDDEAAGNALLIVAAPALYEYAARKAGEGDAAAVALIEAVG